MWQTACKALQRAKAAAPHAFDSGEAAVSDGIIERLVRAAWPHPIRLGHQPPPLRPTLPSCLG